MGDLDETLRNGGEAAVLARLAAAKRLELDDDGADDNVFKIKPRADDDGDIAPAFSDEALALRFAERHVDKLRYVSVWSRWMIWDNTQWREDEKLKALDISRQICREAAREC